MKDWTHKARFYWIPCYWNDNTYELAGRNVVWDYLLLFATWFHNFFIERFAQLGAAITGQDYEPGFPIYILEDGR